MSDRTLLGAAKAATSRYLIALLFLSYAVAFIDRGLIAVVGVSLKQDLSLSDTQFGLLTGPAFVALYALSALPFGFLADRVDARKIIAGGLLIWSVLTAVCGLSHSFSGLFVARMGVGFGEACLVPAGASLIAKVTPRGQLGRSVAVFLMGAVVGNATALIVGGQGLTWIGAHVDVTSIIGHYPPWRQLFMLAAVPGLFLALLMLSVPGRRTAPAHKPLRPALVEALSMLRAKRAAFTFLSISTMCILILSQVSVAWAPLFLSRSFGLTEGRAAVLVGLCVLSTAPLGQWLGGLLIDAAQAKGISAVPIRLQAAGALLCLPGVAVLCLANSTTAALVGYGTFNILVYSATPAGLTGWQQLCPERSRGLITAMLVSVITLVGIGIGPPLVGVISDHLGSGPRALGFGLLTLLVGIAILTALMAIPGVRALTQAEEFALPLRAGARFEADSALGSGAQGRPR